MFFNALLFRPFSILAPSKYNLQPDSSPFVLAAAARLMLVNEKVLNIVDAHIFNGMDSGKRNRILNSMNTNTSKVLVVAFKDSDLIEVPQGVEIARISDTQSIQEAVADKFRDVKFALVSAITSEENRDRWKLIIPANGRLILHRLNNELATLAIVELLL